MPKEKQYLTLSVHDLVDFLLRKGDIDNRVYNQETMMVGTKIHAAFQKKQGNEYLSEVVLREAFDRPLGVINLEGRADGIIIGGPFPIVDEIKSSVEERSSLSSIPSDQINGRSSLITSSKNAIPKSMLMQSKNSS